MSWFRPGEGRGTFPLRISRCGWGKFTGDSRQPKESRHYREKPSTEVRVRPGEGRGMLQGFRCELPVAVGSILTEIEKRS